VDLEETLAAVLEIGLLRMDPGVVRGLGSQAGEDTE
jgi:hypothetical protein